MLRLCQITPIFAQGGCYFGCDKRCTYSYTWTQRFFLLRSCAYLNTLSKFGFWA